ncbi:MAG: ATP-binding cassette domain-containing protein [Alphaproteobacteria bacterium]|nr:ATP-binding cassette domain-containing protein [Alphaproteobacteria bacterium]
MTAALLEIRGLTKHFPVAGGLFAAKGAVRAVEDVSFDLFPGDTFALVGESGCGKTTIAKMILGLERPTAGSIRFKGVDIVNAGRTAMLDYRSQAQAVFQDPYASLNPRLKVKTIIAEPILAHRQERGDVLGRKVAELLDTVGLPASAAELYPHEFSGGQRQRIAIARALALQPRMIVLDEPISALDVSIRAQILNLLADIQEEFALTYLVIAHDLALVEHFSSRVGVMYLGGMVEYGPTEAVYANPAHPYTQALLASVPRPDPDHQPPEGMISGEIASALAPPPGCKFNPRCPRALPICASAVPTRVSPRAGVSHWASCHLLSQNTNT